MLTSYHTIGNSPHLCLRKAGRYHALHGRWFQTFSELTS
jgi:hypothetical protein